MKQAPQDYRDVLKHTAQTEEVLATQFARLADELERQGLPRVAEFLQVASRYHRDRSLKSRALVVFSEK
jgi:hemerythrin superfamily protein